MMTEEEKIGYRKGLDDVEDTLLILTEQISIVREHITKLRIESYIGKTEDNKDEQTDIIFDNDTDSMWNRPSDGC